MRTRPVRLLTSIAVGAVTLTACGSNASPSQRAAGCLRDALDNHKPTSDCRFAREVTVSPAANGTGLAQTVQTANVGAVTCIRKTGNEYRCQTAGGQAYDVLYDGSHIAYQQAGG